MNAYYTPALSWAIDYNINVIHNEKYNYRLLEYRKAIRAMTASRIKKTAAIKT